MDKYDVDPNLPHISSEDPRGEPKNDRQHQEQLLVLRGPVRRYLQLS
jgi:hypothetical protein